MIREAPSAGSPAARAVAPRVRSPSARLAPGEGPSAQGESGGARRRRDSPAERSEPGLFHRLLPPERRAVDLGRASPRRDGHRPLVLPGDRSRPHQLLVGDVQRELLLLSARRGRLPEPRRARARKPRRPLRVDARGVEDERARRKDPRDRFRADERAEGVAPIDSPAGEGRRDRRSLPRHADSKDEGGDRAHPARVSLLRQDPRLRAGLHPGARHRGDRLRSGTGAPGLRHRTLDEGRPVRRQAAHRRRNRSDLPLREDRSRDRVSSSEPVLLREDPEGRARSTSIPTSASAEWAESAIATTSWRPSIRDTKRCGRWSPTRRSSFARKLAPERCARRSRTRSTTFSSEERDAGLHLSPALPRSGTVLLRPSASVHRPRRRHGARGGHDVLRRARALRLRARNRRQPERHPPRAGRRGASSSAASPSAASGRTSRYDSAAAVSLLLAIDVPAGASILRRLDPGRRARRSRAPGGRHTGVRRPASIPTDASTSREAVAQDDWRIDVEPAFVPDFHWAPHLTPTARNVIDQHSFRSPALIVSGPSCTLTLIPDLDLLLSRARTCGGTWTSTRPRES